MNIRQKYELNYLINKHKLDIEKVSDVFSVNVRTIRNDLKNLNEYLSEKYLLEAITVENKIAYINSDLLKCQNLKNEIEYKSNDFYETVVSNEERVLLMLADLCFANKLITIQDLADKYFVSRTTVNSDIVAIKNYCKENDIDFYSNRGKGIGVEGDYALRQSYLTRIFRDYAKLNNHGNNFDLNIYTQWFSNDLLDGIQQIVKTTEKKYNVSLTDVAYEGLVLHIALTIQRYLKKQNESTNNLKTKDAYVDKSSLEYQMANDIVTALNSKFNIQMPECEIVYVSIHIVAKSSDVAVKQSNGDILLEYCTCELINDVSKALKIDLTEDNKLYKSIFQHLSACVYRKQANIVLQNPIKEELVSNFGDLFAIIKKILNKEKYENLIVKNDDEISYILLHFATALKRRKDIDCKGNKIKVLVVCATGVGTAEMLAVELEKYFDFNIVGKSSYHHYQDFVEKHDVDAIISTINLNSKIPNIRVNPILKNDDLMMIKTFVSELNINKKARLDLDERSNLSYNIEKLLRKYSSIDCEEKLIESIKNLLNEVKKERVYMLSELINVRTIKLNCDCDTWIDAVKEAGSLLVKTNKITEEYIDAAIANVKELGPYIVITKGVALPHATNKKGVISTGMSMITLKNPVNFGNKNNDPVKLVVMLAAKDATSHLGALQDLSEFLGNEKFLNLVNNTNNIQEIVSFIDLNETKQERGK